MACGPSSAQSCFDDVLVEATLAWRGGAVISSTASPRAPYHAGVE